MFYEKILMRSNIIAMMQIRFKTFGQVRHCMYKNKRFASTMNMAASIKKICRADLVLNFDRDKYAFVVLKINPGLSWLSK